MILFGCWLLLRQRPSAQWRPTSLGAGMAGHCPHPSHFLSPVITSCVYSAAYTTALDPSLMDSHPSINQAHNCRSPVMVGTGVLTMWHDAFTKLLLYSVVLVWHHEMSFSEYTIKHWWLWQYALPSSSLCIYFYFPPRFKQSLDSRKLNKFLAV